MRARVYQVGCTQTPPSTTRLCPVIPLGHRGGRKHARVTHINRASESPQRCRPLEPPLTPRASRGPGNQDPPRIHYRSPQKRDNT
jgi:hypothetical protein